MEGWLAFAVIALLVAAVGAWIAQAHRRAVDRVADWIDEYGVRR